MKETLHVDRVGFGDGETAVGTSAREELSSLLFLHQRDKDNASLNGKESS